MLIKSNFNLKIKGEQTLDLWGTHIWLKSFNLKIMQHIHPILILAPLFSLCKCTANGLFSIRTYIWWYFTIFMQKNFNGECSQQNYWIHFLTYSTTSSLDIELVTFTTIVLGSSSSTGSIKLSKCWKTNIWKKVKYFKTYIHHICRINISLVSLQHSGPSICNKEYGQLHVM